MDRVSTVFRDDGGEYYCTPQERATYLIATLNEPAALILHAALTGEIYEEVTEVLEHGYCGHHLEREFHSHLKRRSQLLRKFLWESAAAIDHLAHRVHVRLSVHLISK
jgi:hypothetical protein